TSRCATRAGSGAPALEDPVDARRPIIDCHHHFGNEPQGHVLGPRYLFGDFARESSPRHNVTDLVYVECLTSYRVDGPEALRPVGEAEFAATQATVGESGPRLSAFVGFADLTLAAAVEQVPTPHAP